MKTKKPSSINLKVLAEKEGFCTNIPHTAFCKCQKLEKTKTANVNVAVLFFQALHLFAEKEGFEPLYMNAFIYAVSRNLIKCVDRIVNLIFK